MTRGIVAGIVTLVVVLGGIGYLFYAGASSGDAFAYYKHVDEVLAEPQRWEGKHLQMHGFVKPDSIAKRVDAAHAQVDYKFIAVNCDKEIEVRYSGMVPDTFKDRAEVVLKGRLESGRFVAREISAKCPSKYQATLDSPTVTLCTRGDRNVETAAANVPR